MQKLQFTTTIAASPATVWDVMLSPETFKAWTAAFMEGSRYEGSWEKGARICFLAPSGSGMVSEIAENMPHEYISIRHLGFISNGMEDLDSDDVKSWAPSYENYRFTPINGGTGLEIEMDVLPAHAEMMADLWPKALATLKNLCEIPAVATPS